MHPGKSAIRQAADPKFQFQIGYDRAQVGISAPFPIAINGSLHLYAALLYSRKRVRDRTFAVIVNMDPQRSMYYLSAPRQ